MKPHSVDVLAPVLLRYKAAHAAGAILHVSFTTVSEYFWLLRAACECLANLGARAMLYLAAAVSDFYIPKDRVVSCYTVKICTVSDRWSIGSYNSLYYAFETFILAFKEEVSYY